MIRGAFASLVATLVLIAVLRISGGGVVSYILGSLIAVVAFNIIRDKP